MTEQYGSGNPLFDQRMRDIVWPEFVCEDDDVPPYGVIEVTGFELKQGTPGVRLTAQKAEDSYEDRYQKWINGPVRVRAGRPGFCTRAGLIEARMQDPQMDGDLAFGDWFAADTEKEFELKRTKVPAGAMFMYLGGFQDRYSRVLGVGIFQHLTVPFQRVFGKLTEELEAADSGDGWLSAPKEAEAKVCEYDFSAKTLSVLDETFTVANRTNVSFEEDTFFGTVRSEGEWPIDFTGCP